MVLALGIDGGGTSTRCAVLDERFRLRGMGTAGPSNYQDVGVEMTRANLRKAIREACAGLDDGPAAIDTAFFGLASVVCEADRQVIRDAVAGVGFKPNTPLGIDHDIRVALAGGTGGRPGIALIVGTGSSCYGRNAAGEDWRSGGWGYLLDDAGSAFYLGHQALMAIVRAYDGRGPETGMAGPVLKALGVTDMNEIMQRIYHPRVDRTGIAGLAPLVVAASAVDPVAASAMERGAALLAEMVGAVGRRLGFTEPTPVVPVGGLVTMVDDYRQRIADAVTATWPLGRVVEPLLPPVGGAALLALEQVNIRPAVIENVF